METITIRTHEWTTSQNTKEYRAHYAQSEVQHPASRIGIILADSGTWRRWHARNQRDAPHRLSPASPHQECCATLPFSFKSQLLWWVCLFNTFRLEAAPYLSNRTPNLRIRRKLWQPPASFKRRWKHFSVKILESPLIDAASFTRRWKTFLSCLTNYFQRLLKSFRESNVSIFITCWASTEPFHAQSTKGIRILLVCLRALNHCNQQTGRTGRTHTEERDNAN